MKNLFLIIINFLRSFFLKKKKEIKTINARTEKTEPAARPIFKELNHKIKILKRSKAQKREYKSVKKLLKLFIERSDTYARDISRLDFFRCKQLKIFKNKIA